MNIRVISPIQYLNIPDNKTYIVNNLFLTKSTEIRESISSDFHLVRHFGISNLEKIQNDYFICYEGECNSLKGLDESMSLTEMGEVLSDMIYEVLYGLWFIKDHSISATEIFIEGDRKQLLSYNTYSNPSNCKGEMAYTTFDADDFLNLMAYDKELQEFYQRQDFFIPLVKYSDDKATDEGRVSRAHQFLRIARRNCSEIIKVSFYVMILECLFTSNASEVTHQVSERASLYLGGDGLSKQANYETIKEAYVIRSKYVHGSKITKSRNELVSLCQKLDVLARDLLRKVIVDKETDVFLLPDTDANKKKFEKYFRGLIFK